MVNLPFDIRPTGQVIVFIGIQASGKTTFYKELLATHGYAQINLDTLHTRPKESKAIQDCYDRGQSFVVDNTNPWRQLQWPAYVAAQGSGDVFQGDRERRVQSCDQGAYHLHQAIPIFGGGVAYW